MAGAALHRPEVNGPGPGSSEPRLATAARSALPRAVRAAVYAIGALLWLSGAVWLLLHHAFRQASAFGPLPNPAEAPLMRIHGLLAVGGVFLIGWMSAAHVSARWSSERNRRSGLALGVTALLLVLSGYALYYTVGAPHDAAAYAHETVGLLSPVAALAHRWRNRSRI